VASVAGALLYLKVTSVRNALVSRLTRLKEPKYLIGAVVGVLYLYGFVFRRVTANPRPGRPGLPLQPFTPDQLPTIATLGALALMVWVVLYWLLPRSRAALAFSEAEIAFLFPAPIERRTLIHFRWINTQLRILFTALVLALVSAGWPFVPGNAAVRVFGWWLIFSTLDLHAVGSSFAITRFVERGMSSLRRRLLVGAIGVAIVTVAVVGASRSFRAPLPEDLTGPGALTSYVASLFSTGTLAWLLLPARSIVQPLLAYDLPSFIAALGPALVVYVLHYVWVLRAEVSFEEASIAKAEKRAVRRNAMRQGNFRQRERKEQRAPFDLARVRRPELAFLWKNLLSAASYLRPRVALVAIAVIVIVCSALRRPDLEVFRRIAAMMAMIGAGYTLVFGPLLARQDLRQDLPNTDILKTYPLQGWQIVLGEMLTPIAIVTGLLWLMLLTAALTVQPPPGFPITSLTFAAIAVGVLLPFLSAIQVLVMNAAAVLFPAWIQIGMDRGAGIDVFGQRILFLAALLLAMLAGLLPGTIAGAATFLATQWAVGTTVAEGLAVGAAIVVLCVEIGLAIAWLGKAYERFDLSAELRP
jgi:putative ABC exporter